MSVVYACGSNAFRQLSDVDDLVFENFVEVRRLSDQERSESLLAVSWSQTVVSGPPDSIAVLGVQPKSQISRAKRWLGQEAFLAALLEDGHLLRFSNGQASPERYAYADMNGRGELLLVPEDSLDIALIFDNLDKVFETPTDRQILHLPRPEYAVPALSASSETTRHHEQIIAIASGAAHFVLLSSAGRVYSYGDNRYGQTGPFPSSPLPASIAAAVNHLDFFDGLFPSSLACGAFHSVVVTRDGSVYTFGRNNEGQRGGGGGAQGSGAEPELLELDSEEARSTDYVREEEIDQVACGAAHTVVLTRSGRMWCTGANGDGQLGLGDRNPHSEWTENRTLVPILRQKRLRVKRIACSRASTYLELEPDPAVQ